MDFYEVTSSSAKIVESKSQKSTVQSICNVYQRQLLISDRRLEEMVQLIILAEKVAAARRLLLGPTLDEKVMTYYLHAFQDSSCIVNRSVGVRIGTTINLKEQTVAAARTLTVC